MAGGRIGGTAVAGGDHDSGRGAAEHSCGFYGTLISGAETRRIAPTRRMIGLEIHVSASSPFVEDHLAERLHPTARRSARCARYGIETDESGINLASQRMDTSQAILAPCVRVRLIRDRAQVQDRVALVGKVRIAQGRPIGRAELVEMRDLLSSHPIGAARGYRLRFASAGTGVTVRVA